MNIREFEETWYWCVLEDVSESTKAAEPDWSKVPPAKLEIVKAKWEATNQPKPYVEKLKLWGPQIAFFQRQPYYKVTVLEEASVD